MKYLSLLTLLLIFACSSDRKTKKEAIATDSESTDMVEQIPEPAKDTLPIAEDAIPLISGQELNLEALGREIDLSIDISELSLSDVRLLRNAFAARQGYCFMQADLRGAFSTTSWYDERMETRYWEEEEEGKEVTPISYTEEEEAFIARLKEREARLKARNFLP